MIDIQHMNTVTVQLSKHNCVWVWQLLYSVLLCLGTTVVMLGVALSGYNGCHARCCSIWVQQLSRSVLLCLGTTVVTLSVALFGYNSCHAQCCSVWVQQLSR